MAIAEQFAGLQMDQLIGAPLCAAVDAGIQLAESTADFIVKVGFDGTGKVRTVPFGYQRSSANEDGTNSLDEMQVKLPLLAVVPVPNLQVDEVNLLFDIEVRQSERRDCSLELSAGASGKLGALKVGISGSVSAHQTHTRSTDNSAKYHVDIRAVNHGTPEGLARVLDMIAANMTPVVTGSSLRDENGQPLSGQEQAQAERAKQLQSRISRMERQLRAAREGLHICLTQLQRLADLQLNIYREMSAGLRDETGKSLSLDNSDTVEEVCRSWETFPGRTEDVVRMLAVRQEVTEDVSELFALKALDGQGNAADYAEGEIYYAAMAAAQKNAIENQRMSSRLEDELLSAKADYSRICAGA